MKRFIQSVPLRRDPIRALRPRPTTTSPSDVVPPPPPARPDGGGSTATSRKDIDVVPRVCSTLQVRPDRLTGYRERHAAVWPDYQLFLRDDGLLVGTLVPDGLAAAQAAVDATSVSARWEAETAPYFDLPDGRDGRGEAGLDQVFDLDAQLTAIGETPTAPIGDAL